MLTDDITDISDKMGHEGDKHRTQMINLLEYNQA